MKEIKFRLWHRGHMFLNAVPLLCGDGMVAWDFEGKMFTGVLRDDSRLLQFIGKEDRLGKEIYEGDILNITIHELDDSFDTTYQVLWDNRHGGFSLKPISLMTQKNFFEHCYPEELEVIGNVFENPELLKNHSSSSDDSSSGDSPSD